MNHRRPSLWQRLLVFYLCGYVFSGELVVIVRHLHEGTSVVWPALGVTAMVCIAAGQILPVLL
jgi:hypothetical protein